MVAFPALLKRNPEPKMTVASLDARHRVQRRSVMVALEPMVCTPAPAEPTLRARLAVDAHLERTARLRATFYSLRLRQEDEREALIDAICKR